MNQNFIEGERYPLTQKDVDGLILLSGSPLTVMVTGGIDCSRGRRYAKKPGDWEMWNEAGHKINATIGPDLVMLSVEKEPDPNRPEPMIE